MEILVLIGMACFAWYIVDRLCPLATRLVRNLARKTWRGAVKFLWSKPMRRYGVWITLWIWLVAIAVLTTFAALVGLASGHLHGLLLPLMLWPLVIAGWWLIRCQARRRYAPRPMATRRRREEN